MAKRIRVTGAAQVHARYNITGGGDTDKTIIVAAIYHADTAYLKAPEFRQHRADALRAAEWFRSQGVGFVIIESTANYRLLYDDTLRQEGIPGSDRPPQPGRDGCIASQQGQAC
jgi:hypothetical protein